MRQSDVKSASDAIRYFMANTNDARGKNGLAMRIYTRALKFVDSQSPDATLAYGFGRGMVFDKLRAKKVPAESLVLTVVESNISLMLIFPKDTLGRFTDVLDPEEQGIDIAQMRPPGGSYTVQ